MLERIGRLSIMAHCGILLAFCAVFFFIWPGHVPLTEADEARFTEATREMLASGNYMIPMCNFTPRYQKPILFYWLQAAAGKPFGLSETAARVPSAVAATALVLLMYGFLRRRVGKDDRARGAVLVSSAMLAGIPYVAIYGRAAVTDATLTLWITATLICLLEADLRRDGRRGLYLLAAVFAGLAFLTKGPMGLGIPGLVWIAYHIRQRDLLDAARRMPWVPALAVFAAIAAPWYVGTWFYNGPGGGPGFVEHFFLTEHLGRFSTTMQGHGSSNRLVGLLTYAAFTLVLGFPMSVFALREAIRPGDAEPDVVRIRRFAIAWLLVVIGVFSLSKTVMPEYIQSIVGAIGLLFALHFVGRTGTNRGSVVETGLLTLFGVVWTALPVYFLLHPEMVRGRVGVLPFPEPLASVLIGIIAASGVLFILGVTRRDAERKLIWTLRGWAMLFGITLIGVAPIYVHSAYGLTGQLGAYLRELPEDQTIIAYCKESPESLVYYSQKKIIFDERGKNDDAFRRDLNEAIDRGETIVVTDPDGLAVLQGMAGTEIIHRVGRTSVVRVRGNE